MYNAKGALLYFFNFPCIKLHCKWGKAENAKKRKRLPSADPSEAPAATDPCLILLPKGLYKKFNLSESDQDKSFAICVRHFKEHYREGIKQGSIVPTAQELGHDQKSETKISVKKSTTEASFQQILSQLKNGKSEQSKRQAEIVVDLSNEQIAQIINASSPLLESAPWQPPPCSPLLSPSANFNESEFAAAAESSNIFAAAEIEPSIDLAADLPVDLDELGASSSLSWITSHFAAAISSKPLWPKRKVAAM